MSNFSNDFGRAFEYIFITKLNDEINKTRSATIRKDSSYLASQRAWLSVPVAVKINLKKGAVSCISTLFDMEPLMWESSTDNEELYIQSDGNGELGDVRDIVVSRRGIEWEIGYSLKHNHFAVKHSRLSNNIDFGERWLSHKCSSQYWEEIKPIFDYLDKIKGTPWSSIPSKSSVVYKPLLDAFLKEIKSLCKLHKDAPTKMVEYLLGKFDFYKVISIDNDRLTRIQGYNLRGTLNKNGAKETTKIAVPVVSLPTKILYAGFYQGRDNTVEICMDNGWSFTFRIHNASTLVETSLKFDIQILGMPTQILSVNCIWR